MTKGKKATPREWAEAMTDEELLARLCADAAHASLPSAVATEVSKRFNIYKHR